LRQGPKGRIEVTLPPVLNSDTLANLKQDELFVLGALRTLDRLTLTELAEVLHLRANTASAVVRSLEQRGLLYVSDQGIALEIGETRAVTRILRRRHILQWAI